MKTKIVMEKGSGRDTLTAKQTEKHSSRQTNNKTSVRNVRCKTERRRKEKKSNVGKKKNSCQ